MVTFTPVGGGREIGANAYLVSTNGTQALLDCGVHPKKEGRAALPEFSLLRHAPDAVLVSHGHIDHCGAVPYLLRQFPGTIPYATRPTLQIMDRMLHNSVSVMGAMALERGIAEYPLYTHTDVDYALRRAYAIGLDQEFALTLKGDVRGSFYHSGHVLGSAGVLLRTPGHTLFYTGDICLEDQELLDGLAFPDHSAAVDTLVIESTYGNTPEASRTTLQDEIARFADAAAAVLYGEGCVLVPVFALGRTQEMLTIVARLQRERRLPDVPVYTSGLGRALYEVYAKNEGSLRRKADLRPLNEFERIADVRNPQVLRALTEGPCILVATSGMMIENTSSALIAQELVRHRGHGIFFVGYLDPDSLGYRLLHSETGAALHFDLNGSPVTRKLENIQQFNFSAHAPREALRSVVTRIHPRNVVFVHGDPEAVQWMCENCTGDYRTFAPALGETIILEN